MPATRYDNNLLEAMKRAKKNATRQEFEGEADQIRHIALHLLDDVISQYEGAINRDTTEVAEANVSREVLQSARGELNTSFERLTMALQMEYNRRRLSDTEAEDLYKDIEKYLDDYVTEEFESSSLRTAVDILRVAREFSERYLDDDMRVDLEAKADTAIQHALEAQESHRKEELDVVDSKSELEEAREQADSTYTTVRYLIRAALRMHKREQDLGDVIPSLRQALHGG